MSETTILLIVLGVALLLESVWFIYVQDRQRQYQKQINNLNRQIDRLNKDLDTMESERTDRDLMYYGGFK
jgi:cell division protein FtsL